MGPELTPDGKGIGAALFGAARQAVLRILYGHADRRFYRRQLIRLLGVGNGAVQRELARLTQTGILTRTVEGRQTYFQANSQCPVFAEIRDLSRKTFGVADVLREALQPLTGSVRLAFVYGSVAAGTEKSDSDIDVMAVGDLLSLDEVVTALAPAQSSLGREVNPSVYETGEFCRRLAEGKHFTDWLKFGWIREHRPSRQEIEDLFAVADRDLDACLTPSLVADWKFNIAYNAALQWLAA